MNFILFILMVDALNVKTFKQTTDQQNNKETGNRGIVVTRNFGGESRKYIYLFYILESELNIQILRYDMFAQYIPKSSWKEGK